MKKYISMAFCIFIIGMVNSYAADLSNAQIYGKYCKKCHGINGEGNPAKKGPALNDKSINELFDEMMNLQEKGFESTKHEAMQHNLKVLEQKKGIKIDPDSMAKYIYYSFNPEAKKSNKSK
ncbi:MAG: c-type cytochrome [Epsilonproteobacteria bacterium]|nr:c-type cytochrome [Campylobacterota bacterium]